MTHPQQVSKRKILGLGSSLCTGNTDALRDWMVGGLSPILNTETPQKRSLKARTTRTAQVPTVLPQDRKQDRRKHLQGLHTSPTPGPGQHPESGDKGKQHLQTHQSAAVTGCLTDRRYRMVQSLSTRSIPWAVAFRIIIVSLLHFPSCTSEQSCCAYHSHHGTLMLPSS